jgi:hypothetical protein
MYYNFSERQAADEQAMRLGFKDEYEMQLYKDVCGKHIGPKTLKELYANLRLSAGEVKYVKEDYELVIEKNNLGELLERVRYIPIVDRLIEIYLHNFNIKNCCKYIGDLLQEKANEYNSVYDYESRDVYRQKWNQAAIIVMEAGYQISYIYNRVNSLSVDDQKKFYSVVTYTEVNNKKRKK